MLDVFFSISFVNAMIFGVESLLILTGLPLAIIMLGIAYQTDILPPDMCIHGTLSLIVIFKLMIMMDFLQFCSHVLEHRIHSKSHAQHHMHIRPCALDAFKTGCLDAVVSFMLPLFISLWAVRPNKSCAALFGAGYSIWLQFIHSENSYALSLHSKIFVTPRYHRTHHGHPQKNLGHIFVVWDWLYGSICHL